MKLDKYKKIQIVLVIAFFVGVALVIYSVYMNPNPEFKIIDGKQVTLEGMSGQTVQNTTVVSIKTNSHSIDVINVSGTLYEKVNGSLIPLSDEYYSNLILRIDYNETEKLFIGSFIDKYVIISYYNSDSLPITKDTEINLYFEYHFPDVKGCKCKRFCCTYVFVPTVRIGYIP